MSTDPRFWHPFADMAAVREAEILITRGEGSHVWDAQGTRYFDGTASLWCVNAGHGRREIREAVAAQMDELATYQCFAGFSNRPANLLAERLAGYADGVVDDARIFFGLGGGDAIETAGKLARRFFSASGQPERVHLISRGQGYHGTHGLGTSLGGIAPNREGMGTEDKHTSQVPWDSLEALEAEIDRVGAEHVAGVVAEPVIGAGGVHRVPPGYLQGLQALCRRHGILLIADCVIAAFGRLGTWWGVDRFDLQPDMITFAKGVTSGYLPLGGVVISGRIAEPFYTRGGLMFRHGQTYSGHPTACAAALANLDIIEREDLLARGRAMEIDIQDAFAPLAGHSLVGQVRTGIGALGAVAFAPAALAEHPDLPLRTFGQAKARGVLVRPLGDGVAISPPLVAAREEVLEAGAAIGAALDAVADGLGQTAGTPAS
jgi:adenosylmethionine-8-amino-7-oxononanoate aminotransferase